MYAYKRYAYKIKVYLNVMKYSKNSISLLSSEIMLFCSLRNLLQLNINYVNHFGGYKRYVPILIT